MMTGDTMRIILTISAAILLATGCKGSNPAFEVGTDTDASTTNDQEKPCDGNLPPALTNECKPGDRENPCGDYYECKDDDNDGQGYCFHNGKCPEETPTTSDTDTTEPTTTAPTTGSSTDTSTTEPTGWCGDGHMDEGEECDDGNDWDEDACTTDCKNAVCGDGKVWVGHEACDDGNDDNTDDCVQCEPATCGDGFVWQKKLPEGQEPEDCDAGDDNDPLNNLAKPTFECDPDCSPVECGDGVLNTCLEACDNGGDNNDGCVDQGASCFPASDSQSCGNGIVEEPEQCDDGNGVNDDECNNLCVLTNQPECGMKPDENDGDVLDPKPDLPQN